MLLFVLCVLKCEEKYIFTTFICSVCLIVSATIQRPGPCGLWNKTECDALPIPGINKFNSFFKHIACLGLHLTKMYLCQNIRNCEYKAT